MPTIILTVIIIIVDLIRSFTPSSFHKTMNVATHGNDIANNVTAMNSCLAESPSGASIPTGNNFVKTILRIAKEKEEIKVVDDQIGCPTWAADLAAAIMKIIEQRENISGTHLYLYSNEGICSWFEFAKKIVEYAKIDCKIIPIPTKDYPLPAPRPAYSAMSKDKIIKSFGLKIPHWEGSLKQMLEQLQ